jgi:hypothetical protein
MTYHPERKKGVSSNMRPTACLTVLLVVLLLVAQPFFMMPSSAYPYLSLSFDTFSPRTVVVEIPVEPYRQFQFLTNVTLSDPNHYPMEVNLSATVPYGWSGSVVPEHVTFNSTGKQKVVVTAYPMKNITTENMITVYLNGFATYENADISASTSARIYFTYHHAVEVTYRFVKKDQYMNQIDFDLTNKGTGPESIRPTCQCYSDNYEISFTPSYVHPALNGPPSTVSLKVQYRGSKFPMTYTLPIRFTSSTSGMSGTYYFVETNVTVSFIAPDTTQQNYLFVGAIGAFIIVMVVVMVFVLRGPGKGKK